MAITQAMCTSFKVELLEGVHNFKLSGGDTFKIALYTSSATLSASTTAYTTSNEVADGNGYSTGGNTLTRIDPTSSSTTAFTDFADSTWSSSTITARGALIYNSTDSDKAVAVLDFGADKASSGGDFKITFPAADASNAIIRIAQLIQVVVVALGGWGRGTWGLGAWGTAIPVSVTGVVGTTALGSETATGDANIAVTGVAGTSALGTAIGGGGATVTVTGVSATGSVNTVLVWGVIDTSQTPNFSAISTSQTPNWQNVSGFQINTQYYINTL